MDNQIPYEGFPEAPGVMGEYMDASIMPDLQFTVLCDDVVQDRMSGKLVLHGLFSNIEGQNLPMTHTRYFVVNGWCNGTGTFQQATRVLSPDKDPLIEDQHTRFTLSNTHAKHTVIAQFNNITFENAGTYWVEVHLNDRLIISYPFEVRSKL